jgi:DNA-binding NarL/FixJ family response regulator
MDDVAEMGPVQLLSVGFEPGANFEGRIADELARLDEERTIRVLDLLYVAKDTDSDELVVLEHQEQSMGAIAGALLGLRLEDDSSAAGEAGNSPLAALTERERNVLAEIAQGRSNRAVEKHTHAIFAKLGLAKSEETSKRVMAALMFLADGQEISEIGR